MERKHDYARAAELLGKSIRLNPNDPVAHYRLSRVYDRLGKKEQADAERTWTGGGEWNGGHGVTPNKSCCLQM